MAFYDLPKQARAGLVEQIRATIQKDLIAGKTDKIAHYFSDEDTYIRKSGYLSMGRIYFDHPELQAQILSCLEYLLANDNFKIRQTVINSAGEIGKKQFEKVQYFFDAGLFDTHHSPRNAVIGSIKKMGEVNAQPVLNWSKKYLHHEDKEIRREICHGIELRGRKYPEDILPLLQELQYDKTARVRNTLVHVIGQISYKKGCIQKVVEHLKRWENKELVAEALDEIIDVHNRYRNFSAMTQDEVMQYIETHYE
jgi:HEAT repeat protein